MNSIKEMEKVMSDEISDEIFNEWWTTIWFGIWLYYKYHRSYILQYSYALLIVGSDSRPPDQFKRALRVLQPRSTHPPQDILTPNKKEQYLPIPNS